MDNGYTLRRPFVYITVTRRGTLGVVPSENMIGHGSPPVDETPLTVNVAYGPVGAVELAVAAPAQAAAFAVNVPVNPGSMSCTVPVPPDVSGSIPELNAIPIGDVAITNDPAGCAAPLPIAAVTVTGEAIAVPSYVAENVVGAMPFAGGVLKVVCESATCVDDDASVIESRFPFALENCPGPTIKLPSASRIASASVVVSP
jgi:hypothetical protein